MIVTPFGLKQKKCTGKLNKLFFYYSFSLSLKLLSKYKVSYKLGYTVNDNNLEMFVSKTASFIRKFKILGLK